VQTKKFSQQPFDAVADNGLPHFAGNRQSQTRFCIIRGPRKQKNEKMFAVVPTSPVVTGEKIRPAAKFFRLRDAMFRSTLRMK
jgi:hypothetical protein